MGTPAGGNGRVEGLLIRGPVSLGGGTCRRLGHGHSSPFPGRGRLEAACQLQTRVSHLLPNGSRTDVLRKRLVDRLGGRLGRVDDVIARFGEGGHPPITGLVARIARRRRFIPRDRLGEIRPRAIALTGETLDLARFERRPGEVLLGSDVLGRRLISVVTGRLVVAHDLELARVNGELRLV